jgi:hypothetical protein
MFGTALGRNGTAPGVGSSASTRRCRRPGCCRIMSSPPGSATLFPSLRPAGDTNLVNFPAKLRDADRIEVYDPISDCRAIKHHGHRSCLAKAVGLGHTSV